MNAPVSISRSILQLLLITLAASSHSVVLFAQQEPGESLVQEYFRQQTKQIEQAAFAEIDTLADWKSKRPQLRQQLLDMLGLNPLPKRTDLQATVTGVTEHPEFRVERLHFQSRPGLYVTANFYVPKGDGPFPTILYGCGHAPAKEDGISFGNKTRYQHHGCWFARNGYACLTIDSLQLGEIEAIHHGTYRYGMWWWVNRGYTPAGVEAWNCVRALDYLETRPEVDANRLGVTGRSGGGIYSWWITAIDDRIQVAVPVAGITDLRNQIVDGCIEGHCDCMFHINTYRWDFPMIAALAAPRPLLISNSDRDSIFPLDGVIRTHAQVRRIYNLYDKPEHLALQITAGPHQDTQELRIHAFRWFNHFLRHTDELIDQPAVPFFEPEQLQVFSSPDMIPEDALNAEIHETFVPVADEEALRQATEGKSQTEVRETFRQRLQKKTFAGWPQNPPATKLEQSGPKYEFDNISVHHYTFASQPPYELPVLLLSPMEGEQRNPGSIVVRVLDSQAWQQVGTALAQAIPNLANRLSVPGDSEGKDDGEATGNNNQQHPAWDRFKKSLPANGVPLALILPRGIGPTRWDQSGSKHTHYRRRFHLIGQTLDGMRVWDVRRAIQALHNTPELADRSITLQGSGVTGAIAMYASLFEPTVTELQLDQLPTTHRQGPFLLNVRRVWNMKLAKDVALNE